MHMTPFKTITSFLIYAACSYITSEEPTTPLLPDPKPSIASKKGPSIGGMKHASFDSDTAERPDRGGFNMTTKYSAF